MNFLYDELPGVSITCPHCFTRYSVKYALIIKVRKTKCSHCAHIWIHQYAEEASSVVIPASINAADKSDQISGNSLSLADKGREWELNEIIVSSSRETFPVEKNVFNQVVSRGMAMGLMVAMAVIVSFAGLTFRNFQNPDIWEISVFRAGALSAAIGVFLFVRYREKVLERIHSIGFSGFYAGAMLAGAQIFYMSAMSHTTVANTTFSLCSIPFLTAILARVFLKEEVKLVTFVTMLGAALGIVIMASGGLETGSGYGIFLALVTAFMFSCFAITVRKNRMIDMVPALMVSGLLNVVIGLILIGGVVSFSAHDIVLSLIWGVVIQGFGFSLFIISARYLLAAEITLFSLLEFSLAPIWVWLFLSEEPTFISLVGGVIIITAVFSRAAIELMSAKKLEK